MALNFLLKFLILIQRVLTPYILLFRPHSKGLQARYEFESLNLSDPFCASFKDQGEIADYCFEVSSDGEFEQVRPIIDELLRTNRRVELIYCSESLEKP